MTRNRPFKARNCAGAAIEFIENAVMLYNGQYFRKGTKRALEKLRQLGLPFDPEARILAVIQAETVEKIRAELTEVFALTDEYLAEYEKEGICPKHFNIDKEHICCVISNNKDIQFTFYCYCHFGHLATDFALPLPMAIMLILEITVLLTQLSFVSEAGGSRVYLAFRLPIKAI